MQPPLCYGARNGNCPECSTLPHRSSRYVASLNRLKIVNTAEDELGVAKFSVKGNYFKQGPFYGCAPLLKSTESSKLLLSSQHGANSCLLG
jgi:hypothetical protein